MSVSKDISVRVAPTVKKEKGTVSFDFEFALSTLTRRVKRVVNNTAQMASASARERAPVRKIFTGGRRAAHRFYSIEEARTELPAFLTTEPRFPSGRRMSAGQALSQLQHTPIATSRNRANSYQRTSVINYKSRSAKDDLGNPRKDEYGNLLYAAKRDIDFRDGKNRLFDREQERFLTPRGRYELKKGRAVSYHDKYREEDARHGRLKTAAERSSARARDLRDDRGRIITEPGELGQVGGNLRRSIHVEDRSDGDKPKVSVVAGGEEAPYARFVEFGTRHAAAQPFLRPALKHVEGPFKSNMRAAFPGSK